MLRQGLHQRLQQRLSPQQIQYIKLLQVPTAQLEERIEEEREQNPLIELGESEEDVAVPQPDSYETAAGLGQAGDELDFRMAEQDKQEEFQDGLAQEEYFGDSESEDYKTRLPNAFEEDDHYEAPVVEMRSLYDSLEEQVSMLNLDEADLALAFYLIGSLDEDGYLRRPLEALINDLAFHNNLEVTEAHLEGLLLKIQSLEPAGVGARNLRECLLLQLHRKHSDPLIRAAEKVISTCFEEFTKKHFDKIYSKTGLDEEEFKEVYQLINHLNPKPGESETVIRQQYIIPDFMVVVENGELEVRLNSRNMPNIRISRKYKTMLESLQKAGSGKKPADKETYDFLKEKMDSAKSFIDAIRQRQFTLLDTMGSIVQRQKEYFLSEGLESSLKPMILKDVADDIGMDISTVSRVVNSKYVQTDFGILSLKYFFSEGIATEGGEEVSNREVKKALKDIIDEEDKKKPYSDEILEKLLKEKGYDIARRTVAKYREMMNIPVARMRKEL